MTVDLERAEVLLDLRRPVEAETVARTVLSEEPDSLDALGILARALLAQGRYDEALPVTYAVAGAAPDDEYGHRLSSIVLQNLARTTEAVRAAEVAVSCSPAAWETHYTLGFALLATSGRRGAANALGAAEEAIRLAPHEAALHHLAGLCQRRMGREKAASASFREAARLEPGHTGAVGELAKQQLEHGRLRAAGRLVSSGLAVAPQEADLRRSHDAILLNAVVVLLTVGIFGGGLIGTSYDHFGYVLRLGVAVASPVALLGTLWWMSRGLPQGMQAWPSIYRRSQGSIRVLVRVAIPVSVAFLAVCVLPPSASPIAVVLSIGLLAVFATGVLVVTVAGFLKMFAISR